MKEFAIRSDLIVNYNNFEDENVFRHNNKESIPGVPNDFLELLFRSEIKTFYFKEDIQKCFRLFQIVKDKCNYVQWTRVDWKDGFCLGYRRNTDWKVKIVEEKNPVYPIVERFQEKKQIFDAMIEICSDGCYICLMENDQFILYENLYDISTNEDIYNRYINEWNLPEYSNL
jgi:hypothetical protein